MHTKKGMSRQEAMLEKLKYENQVKLENRKTINNIITALLIAVAIVGFILLTVVRADTAPAPQIGSGVLEKQLNN